MGITWNISDCHTRLKKRGPLFLTVSDSQWPSVWDKRTVANWTYPICHGYFRKRSKTSCTHTHTLTQTHILHTGVGAGATGWCITVKHNACNELICSVKWIEPQTGRAVICQRPSMTVAQERQQCYGSIPCDTREHVKLYNQIPSTTTGWHLHPRPCLRKDSSGSLLSSVTPQVSTDHGA